MNDEENEKQIEQKEKIKEVQDTIRAAKKAAEGNVAGAVVDALKSGVWKKNLKRTLIRWIIQALLWIVIIGAIVGIVTAIVGNMISLLANIGTNVKGFFSEWWQYINDDYWTNIGEKENGEDTEFIIDTRTGKTVAYYKTVTKGGSGISETKELIFHKEDLEELLKEHQKNGEYEGMTVYDLDENEIWILTEEYLDNLGRDKLITRKYTLVDAYLKDLGDQGISIKDLRLLGNADYSDEEKLLGDPDNRAIVEKYMSEFIRADIITQQIHKRNGVGTVNGEEVVCTGVDGSPLYDGDSDNNQNEVDGGIYLYRSKSHEDVDLEEIEDAIAEANKSRVLFVGDSRTIDMFYDSDDTITNEIHSGIAVYAKHGWGETFLEESIADYGLDNFDVLVTWMGGNDNGDFSAYESRYNELIAQGKKIVVCTVGPTDDNNLEDWDHPNYENSQMMAINQSMVSWANSNGVQVIDLYKYIEANITIDSVDGIHYTPRPTTQIWDKIVSELGDIVSESGSPTVSNGSSGSGSSSSDEYMPVGEIHKAELDKDEDYVRMTYVKKEAFDEALQKTNDQNKFVKVSKPGLNEDIRHVYTLDEEGNIIVAKITAAYDVERTLNKDSDWFKEKASGAEKDASKAVYTNITAEPVQIQYREYVAKYGMTYEFLINLCQVTQNPEFVYHVALLARDTDISLVILDTEHITKTATETLTEKSYYKVYSEDQPSTPDSPTSYSKDKVRTTHVEYELNPEMKIKYANAWTYYEAFDFLRHIDGEITERDPEIENDRQNSLRYFSYEDAHYEGSEFIQEQKYWYDTFTRTEKHTRDMEVDVTYEDIPKISQEKSKQFLGLLRNGKGECTHDCYVNPDPKNNPIALKCAREATFKRSGTNVAYTIPGTTEQEMAYNKLTSGLQLLYAALQNNTSGYEASDKVLGKQINKDEDTMEGETVNPNDSKDVAQKTSSYAAQHDFSSAYVVKLEPMVEHLRYLMTLPNNEYIDELRTLNGLLPNTNGADDDDDDDDDMTYWWPVNAENSPITSYFGRRNSPTKGATTDHKGIDIGVPVGTEVIATAAGTVIYVGDMRIRRKHYKNRPWKWNDINVLPS